MSKNKKQRPSAQDKGTSQTQKSGAGKMFKDIIVIVVLAVALAAAVKTFVVDTRVIPTGSMLPTIELRDRVIISRLAHWFGYEPERGDIIVFEPPAELNEKDDLIKRVVGLPGEEVRIISGQVYIDGIAIDEPYVAERGRYDFGPVQVPEGCCFVLGDNRNFSNDSHLWSDPFIPFEEIKGKTLCIYWPLGRIGGI